VLKYDPIPWLLSQEGESAVRARRSLGLEREGDGEVARRMAERAAKSQLADGSFAHSPMKTAGVVCLLADLAPEIATRVMSRAAEFLVEVLASQPGYERARGVQPGELTEACDLAGFFGPYEARNAPEVLARGAREMNFFRQFEPLLGPKSPVRARRRSSLDRAGPGSCYAWGLVPLCYIIEALCRGGFGADPRLRPAVNALVGAQRKSGGWCRNLGGGVECTIPAIRALGVHPRLRQSRFAEAALGYVRATQSGGAGRKAESRWRGSRLFAALEAVARFDLAIAKEIIGAGLKAAARHQRRNGTFGTPCAVARVAAVVAACCRLAK
jgi:hypothetical protein